MSIDGRGRLIRSPARQRLELHEDEIPDLDEAVAVGVGRTRRPARDMIAVIVENLRARAARAGVAHRPEIVAGGDADDPALGQAGDFPPEPKGVVVVVIDRDRQAVFRHAEIPRQQVPGILDRLLLEVVAEGEIAQHLEEGVVPRGIADVVEIVVLAAGADAFLRGAGAKVGPLLDPGEDVLELHHSGVGEHQGRVVARDERARGHDLMRVPGEELEKVGTDLVYAGHERAALARISKKPRFLEHRRSGRQRESWRAGWGDLRRLSAMKAVVPMSDCAGPERRPRAPRRRERGAKAEALAPL